MTARFTRVEGSKWAIASDDPNHAFTTVMVDRLNDEPVSMPLGELIGPHATLRHMWTYKLGAGAKAPTSGKMGKNKAGKGRRRRKQYTLPSWQHGYSEPKADPGRYPADPDPRQDPEPNFFGNPLEGAQPKLERAQLEAKHKPDPSVIPPEVHTLLKGLQEKPDHIDLSEYAKTTWVNGEIDVLLHEIDVLRQVAKDATPTVVNVVSGVTGTVLTTTKDSHKVLPDLLSNLLCGNHTYLVGPAGSGKTHLAVSASEALGRKLAICGAMLTKHEVVGYQDANGNYVTTAARQAYEFGYVLLWDEVDSSNSQALVAVNAMLSNTLYTFPDRTVERHDDFVVIAAGNTYGTGADRAYSGRLVLDGATLDRFDFLRVEYDLKLERTLALEAFALHGGTDLEQVNAWVTFVVKVRDSIEDMGLTHIVSPRASINGAKKLARGQQRSKVLDQVIWKGLGDDAKTQIKNAVGEAI